MDNDGWRIRSTMIDDGHQWSWAIFQSDPLPLQTQHHGEGDPCRPWQWAESIANKSNEPRINLKLVTVHQRYWTLTGYVHQPQMQKETDHLGTGIDRGGSTAIYNDWASMTIRLLHMVNRDHVTSNQCWSAIIWPFVPTTIKTPCLLSLSVDHHQATHSPPLSTANVWALLTIDVNHSY